MSLYLNPSLTSEPAVPNAVIQGSDMDYRFLLNTTAFSPNAGDAYDEFKLGTSYNSVIATAAPTPVPTATPEPTATPTPTPVPTYSISLSCSSAADLLATGDTVYNSAMDLAGVTTVKLKASYKSSTLQTTTVNAGTKAASFANVTNGNYVIIVSRAGFMERAISVTVSGGNVSLGDKPLIPGDIFVDGIIDGSDTEMMFASIGFSYEDLGYNSSLDVNLDGIVDGTDSELLLVNLGYNIGFYGETVDYNS